MSDLASDLILNWPRNERFDARKAINSTSAKLTEDDLVLLATTEYIDRVDHGEHISTIEFAQEFPEIELPLIESIAQVQGDVLRGIPRVGSELAGYTLVRLLSLTSSTHVYLATDPRADGRSVVIKVVPKTSREAAITARLCHENAVQLLAVDNDTFADKTVMVLSYGGLHQPFPEVRTTVEYHAALRFLKSIALGLEHAHSRGIIHNDVRLKNTVSLGRKAMLIDFNASVLIGEFGVRRPISSVSLLSPATLTDLVSNECFTVANTFRDDYYAFSLLAYEVFAGRPPWVLSRTPCLRTQATELQNKRHSLSVESVRIRFLSDGQNELIWKIITGRDDALLPSQLLSLLESLQVRRRTRVAIAIALTTCILVWLTVFTREQSESSASTAELRRIQRDEIDPALKQLIKSGRLFEAHHFLLQRQISQSVKEKALFAYVTGIIAPNASIEEALYREILSSGLADAAVYSNYAFLLLRQGRTQEGEDCLRTAIRMSPDIIQPYILLASFEIASSRQPPERGLRTCLEIVKRLGVTEKSYLLSSAALDKYETNRAASSEEARRLYDSLRAVLSEKPAILGQEEIKPFALPYSNDITSASN